MVRSRLLLALGLIFLIGGIVLGLWTLSRSGSAYGDGVYFVEVTEGKENV